MRWEALISSGTVQRIGPRLVCSLLFILVLVFAGAQAVQAEPSAITQAKSQAAALEAQLKELNGQDQLLVEKYESAIAQLTQTRADAAENADLLTQAQQDQESAESALSDRLTQIYKQGRSSELDILLSSSSLSELVDRVRLLERIGKQDAGLLEQVTTYRAQVTDRQVKLAALLEKQQTAADQVQAASEAVTQKLAQNKQSLTGKQALIAQLEQEWQAQQAEQARLQKEAQAKLEAALAAAQAAAQAGGKATAPKPVPNSEGQHRQGVSNILKPEQIALVAQKAGFSGENLVIAVAVAMAESGSDANAVGRLHTYGLWQILSHAHPTMINPSNPDASKWYDPYVNAGFAYRISGGGKTWVPWSVYTNGAYLKRMGQARAGVNLLLSDPSSVVPPSVK
jgi:peptidoglycan hydrolase CwlO-like protein